MALFSHNPRLGVQPSATCPAFLVPANMASEWAYHGMPEASLINWAKEFVKPNQRFIDVGTHVGTWTVQLAPLSLETYAFEPQQQTYFGLCGNLYLNDVKNVKPYCLALGSQAGEATLKIISEDGGGSSLADLPTNANPLRTERVLVQTLDSFELSDVGFIKLDVEGSELEVLKGAVKTITTWEPKIIFESWDADWYEESRKKTEAFFTEIGYHIVPINGYPYIKLATKRGT